MEQNVISTSKNVMPIIENRTHKELPSTCEIQIGKTMFEVAFSYSKPNQPLLATMMQKNAEKSCKGWYCLEPI